MNAPWITYRPELKVLDCTVRDGGLVNNHQFRDEFVRAVYETCVEAGIDYMEIGYRNSRNQFSSEEFGPWKFSGEEDVRRIVGDNQTDLKLAVMCDAGKSDWRTDVLPASESAIDVIRVAFYVHQVSEAVEMITDAKEKGYETSANLMAVSTATETEIEQALEVVAESPVDVICVVDSFGSLYAEQVERLVKRYMECAAPKGKEVGMHAHNNQQLAFANTIEAIIHGANRVDASMAGIGRGAGNCPMELLIGFLRNPKFHIRPIYKVLQEQLQPLRNEIEWGPYVEYNITGQLNEHPRAAIAARKGEERDKFVELFDRLTSDV